MTLPPSDEAPSIPKMDETSPLEERLIALIKANGPITVADYMNDALFHPHEGYYRTGAPIGADGDFITAPEASQIFGELIGLWLVQSWIDMGEPDPFNLIELGPGRGVLMADILRAARLKPDFLAAANLWMVETSGRLRVEQKKRLDTALTEWGIRHEWADRYEDTPDGPFLLVANEFFDCLPIHQYIRIGAGWRERMVGLTDDETRLSFTNGNTPPPASIGLPPKESALDGDIVEQSPEAIALTEAIAQRLKTDKGRALIIDYGHAGNGIGDTLQAVRRHAFWPVLTAPGKADLTAHVSFSSLVETAFEAGAAAYGPVTQGVLLDRLGLAARVERLCLGASPSEVESIRAGAFRIAASSEMGELFKAICLSSSNLPIPAGFENADTPDSDPHPDDAP